MICPRCGTNAVKSDIGIMKPIPIWYCRTCKEEVKDEPEPKVNQDSEYPLIDDYGYLDHLNRGDC